MKTFENPMLKTIPTKAEQFTQTTEKIFEDIPTDRTILAINFDKKYDDVLIRKIFGTMGKLRRIESGQIKQKGVFAGGLNSGGRQKTIYFYVVIFKHEKDMIRAFDLELFQHKMLERFLPDYRNMTEYEKEEMFQAYAKSIEGNVDMTNQITMTDDGFMIVQGKPGGKSREAFKEEFDGKRKRKKKEKEMKDFYRFQLKNLNDIRVFNQEDEIGENEMYEHDFAEDLDNDEWEDLDVAQLDNTDYLNKRKEILTKKFQQDVNKLKKLKN